MTNLTTHIASAVEIKRQMNDQMTTLYGRLRDPDAFSKEKTDAGKVLERQYAPALRKIASATTHADLVERRDRLNTRLNKGWAYCSLHPQDEAAHAAWEAFLVEYSVIVDALNHVGIVAGVMERISRIESFVEGVAHASV
jgi:hypothetical protein